MRLNEKKIDLTNNYKVATFEKKDSRTKNLKMSAHITFASFLSECSSVLARNPFLKEGQDGPGMYPATSSSLDEQG